MKTIYKKRLNGVEKGSHPLSSCCASANLSIKCRFHILPTSQGFVRNKSNIMDEKHLANCKRLHVGQIVVSATKLEGLVDRLLKQA